MTLRCVMVVGHKIDAAGEGPGEEIVCGKPAWRFFSAPAARMRGAVPSVSTTWPRVPTSRLRSSNVTTPSSSSAVGDARVELSDLSVDQREVYEAVLAWQAGSGGSHRVLTLGGVAGSGKSTLVGVLARAFEERRMTVAYAALTGRASSILGRKLAAAGASVTGKVRPDAKQKAAGAGSSVQLELFDSALKARGGPAFCGTLHRLLYRAVVNDREELLGWRKRVALDRQYDLLVIDEASMISREVLEDLTVHGVPVLAVGDHGQLPPVGSSGSVVDDPELRLEKIHRQAAGNPIIALSDVIRRTGVLRTKLADGKQVIFGDRKKDLRRFLRGAGGLSRGIVCWRNETRVWLNGVTREEAGFEGEPKKNEVLICLRNAPPVFNGMRGLLTSDSVVPDATPWIVSAEIAFPEENLPSAPMVLCASQFNRPELFREVEELRGLGIPVRSMSEAGMLFDFGYALTCHKAQGSEFDTGVVYLDRRQDPTSEDWRRWCYTAVTRAKRRLIVLR